MDTEIRYALTSGNGSVIKVGSAKEILDHLLATDVSLSDMRLAKKPMVYWKTGLSVKAAKV